MNKPKYTAVLCKQSVPSGRAPLCTRELFLVFICDFGKYAYLCRQNQEHHVMTAVQLNAMNTELWQSIGAIADSEPLMKRLTRYAKKLVKEREADPTLMTKEAFFQMIDEAKKGPSKRFENIEELDRYISSL